MGLKAQSLGRLRAAFLAIPLVLFSHLAFASYPAWTTTVWAADLASNNCSTRNKSSSECIEVAYQDYLAVSWETRYYVAWCSTGDRVFYDGSVQKSSTQKGQGDDRDYVYSPTGARCYTPDEELPPIEVCNPPNYIHPETNECTAPEEVCFTSIESMADRCVFIGETTPEAPPGCIRDEETQAEICLSENEGCYVADGKEICPTPGMVCGVKNGTFSCVAPEQEGCGYFNGERVCFTPDGHKVSPDSPDHPDNGGNLDGDDTNDPTDPRTPEEGGNPDKQPIDTTGQGDGATEGTAKEQLKALRQLRDEAVNQNKANTGNAAALEQGISSGIASAGDAATAQLDQHIDGVNSGSPMSEDDLSGVEAKISNLFGVSTQCVDIVFGTDDLHYTITCQQMDKIRDFLGFILYGFTLIRLFQILVRPAAQGTP